MFNPEYEYPMQMFSSPHIIALCVIFVVILLVFFSRKFFIKYKTADFIFRYTLVALLLFFELVPYYHGGHRTLFSVVIGTYPLCGHLLWLSVIALASNSTRLTKLFYPLAIIGALLSLIFLDMDCSFPHFRAFQFFFTHSCFLLGTLYFVFTKKITKYTLKDLGKSCLLLLSLSVFSLILVNAKHSMDDTYFNDPYFIISPPGGLEFFKDALGQTGYTFAYVFIILAVMFAIYGITFLLTKKRNIRDNNLPVMKTNKYLDKLSLINNNKVAIYFTLILSFTTYITTLAKFTDSIFLTILDNILFFIIILSVIILEVVNNYKNYKENKNS